LRIASIHFASATRNPAIPLGNDEEYTTPLIYGNKYAGVSGPSGSDDDDSNGCSENDTNVDSPDTDLSTVFRHNEAYGEEEEIPTPDAFYFRLNQQNLYYTQDENSVVVLGAISIANVL